LLDSQRWIVECVQRLFKTLNDTFDLAVITTNWHSEAEETLERLNILFTDRKQSPALA
jgi:hypothetical protein